LCKKNVTIERLTHEVRRLESITLPAGHEQVDPALFFGFRRFELALGRQTNWSRNKLTSFPFFFRRFFLLLIRLLTMCVHALNEAVIDEFCDDNDKTPQAMLQLN
jgi:hypothetical protein